MLKNNLFSQTSTAMPKKSSDYFLLLLLVPGQKHDERTTFNFPTPLKNIQISHCVSPPSSLLLPEGIPVDCNLGHATEEKCVNHKKRSMVSGFFFIVEFYEGLMVKGVLLLQRPKRLLFIDFTCYLAIVFIATIPEFK